MVDSTVYLRHNTDMDKTTNPDITAKGCIQFAIGCVILALVLFILPMLANAAAVFIALIPILVLVGLGIGATVFLFG